jgi:hypothetical protein
VELENGVSAGISLRKLGLDLVPIFEEHTARLERGVSVEEWSEKPETEKALIIAQRRIAIQMKNLQTEAEIRKAKQESKKHARN